MDAPEEAHNNSAVIQQGHGTGTQLQGLLEGAAQAGRPARPTNALPTILSSLKPIPRRASNGRTAVRQVSHISAHPIGQQAEARHILGPPAMPHASLDSKLTPTANRQPSYTTASSTQHQSKVADTLTVRRIEPLSLSKVLGNGTTNNRGLQTASDSLTIHRPPRYPLAAQAHPSTAASKLPRQALFSTPLPQRPPLLNHSAMSTTVGRSLPASLASSPAHTALQARHQASQLQALSHQLVTAGAHPTPSEQQVVAAGRQLHRTLLHEELSLHSSQPLPPSPRSSTSQHLLPQFTAAATDDDSPLQASLLLSSQPALPDTHLQPTVKHKEWTVLGGQRLHLRDDQHQHDQQAEQPEAGVTDMAGNLLQEVSLSEIPVTVLPPQPRQLPGSFATHVKPTDLAAGDAAVTFTLVPAVPKPLLPEPPPAAAPTHVVNHMNASTPSKPVLPGCVQVFAVAAVGPPNHQARIDAKQFDASTGDIHVQHADIAVVHNRTQLQSLANGPAPALPQQADDVVHTAQDAVLQLLASKFALTARRRCQRRVVQAWRQWAYQALLDRLLRHSVSQLWLERLLTRVFRAWCTIVSDRTNSMQACHTAADSQVPSCSDCESDDENDVHHHDVDQPWGTAPHPPVANTARSRDQPHPHASTTHSLNVAHVGSHAGHVYGDALGVLGSAAVFRRALVPADAHQGITAVTAYVSTADADPQGFLHSQQARAASKARQVGDPGAGGPAVAMSSKVHDPLDTALQSSKSHFQDLHTLLKGMEDLLAGSSIPSTAPTQPQHVSSAHLQPAQQVPPPLSTQQSQVSCTQPSFALPCATSDPQPAQAQPPAAATASMQQPAQHDQPEQCLLVPSRAAMATPRDSVSSVPDNTLLQAHVAALLLATPAQPEPDVCCAVAAPNSVAGVHQAAGATAVNNATISAATAHIAQQQLPSEQHQKQQATLPTDQQPPPPTVTTTGTAKRRSAGHKLGLAGGRRRSKGGTAGKGVPGTALYSIWEEQSEAGGPMTAGHSTGGSGGGRSNRSSAGGHAAGDEAGGGEIQQQLAIIKQRVVQLEHQLNLLGPVPIDGPQGTSAFPTPDATPLPATIPSTALAQPPVIAGTAAITTVDAGKVSSARATRQPGSVNRAPRTLRLVMPGAEPTTKPPIKAQRHGLQVTGGQAAPGAHTPVPQVDVQAIADAAEAVLHRELQQLEAVLQNIKCNHQSVLRHHRHTG